MLNFLIILFISWKIYEHFYYKGEKFLNMKSRIQKYINECNQLNSHIEELKNTYIGINQLDFGKSDYQDLSRYNYKRPELKKQKQSNNIYNCSRTVCDSARKQPFKYICKYFNIKPCEENLEKFEKVLNNFEAAEEGKRLIVNQKKSILKQIESEIPFLIKKISKKKFEKKLGFEHIDLSTIYFPKYVFSYVSSGGNSSLNCNVVMDIENLNKFISYLSEIIKFNKSVVGQRALMTSSLRRKILIRDNYTCQICGNSKQKEPNLLLEIDHIIPLSRGGMTSEENLQTLCWKCNRSKGTKILGKNISNIENKFVEHKHTSVSNFRTSVSNVKTSESAVSYQNENVVICLNCGHENGLNVKYCESCGILINENPAKENLIVVENEEKHEEKSIETVSLKENKPKFNETVQENKLQEEKHPEPIILQTKEKEIDMYNKDKGLYPAGQYIVGEDIENGKYLVKSREKLLGTISLYESYKAFLKDDIVSYNSFSGDYHLLLKEPGMMIVVENADLQRL